MFSANLTRARKTTAALTKFASPFYELLYRCCLVVTTDQEHSLAFMHNAAGDDAHLWKEKLIDVEDSRTVVEALNNRLVLGDEGFLFKSLDPAAIPILLDFLMPFMRHDAHDLYPMLLGSGLKHMWYLLANPPDARDVALLVDGVKGTLNGFA